MRVLTVRQPWAWAIIHGGKDVENRARNLAGSYRGPVAIHVAGKYADPPGLALEALHAAMDAWCGAAPEHTENDDPWFKDVGKIIGVAHVVDVHHVTRSTVPSRRGEPVCWDQTTPPGQLCSQWAESMYDGCHLVLANPRPLPDPIPFKGALGLRHLDPEVVARIEAQLTAFRPDIVNTILTERLS